MFSQLMLRLKSKKNFGLDQIKQFDCDSMPREVIVTYEVFKEICRYSSKYASFKMPREKWVECMGYLFAAVCKSEDKQYVLKEAIGMASGNEMRVEMPPEELAKIESIEKQRPDLFLGGWWHTHPNLSLFFSETDVQNQSFYQTNNEDGLGLVFDLYLISETFLGFKIFRNDSKDAKTYHEVSYRLEGFTEEKLKEALQYLGGITPTMIHNLSIHYGFKTGELITIDPLEVPSTSKPITEADDYFKRAEQSFNQKDFKNAIKNMRLAAELYIQGKEVEMAIDSFLDAARYCIITDQTYISDALFLRIEDIIEKNQLESPEYFLGKMHYMKGLVKAKEKNFTKAAMEMKMAISKFDPEEDYVELYDAYYMRGMYMELMGAETEALQSYSSALRFLRIIINESDDEDIEKRNWNQLLNKITEKTNEIKSKNTGQKVSRIT
jgi:tetratricopeptide (TPR) repeat protein